MTKHKPSTRLNRTLGVVCLAVYLVSTVITLMPGYELSRTANIVLAASFLILLGFGSVVERLYSLSVARAPPPDGQEGNDKQ